MKTLKMSFLALSLSAVSINAFSGTELLDFSANQTLDAVKQSVSSGVFIDSSSSTNSPDFIAYDDLCLNIDGPQTSVPTGHIMAKPGYCRMPCSPISGVQRSIGSCSTTDYGKTGYILYEDSYTQSCTNPYGTRSIHESHGYSSINRCVYEQFSVNDFSNWVFRNAAGSTAGTETIGFQLGFTDTTPNKYTGREIDVIYNGIVAYKSCNNSNRFNEVIVGKPTSISPDRVLGTSVSNHWYKSGVSDSNCNKVNFPGTLFLSDSRELSTDFTSRFTLRGLNLTTKAKPEPANGYQLTLYTISGQEVVFCVGKQVSVGVFSHYSGCLNRDANTNKQTYLYTTGYTQPAIIEATPLNAPDLEPEDPYEYMWYQ